MSYTPRQPAPRPVLPIEHQLDPIVEMAIDSYQSIKPFAAPGNTVPTETVHLAKDGIRASVNAAKAALMLMMQIGIPHDHEMYPKISKFDTEYPANHYYLDWCSRVVWVHHPDFVHIPGYSRYVIDCDGHVKNAYNGKDIEPLNAFMHELVPDGKANKLRKASNQTLIMLAWGSLPEDFIDYGFGVYSHLLDFNKLTGKIEWVPKEVIIAKNNNSGTVQEIRDINMFQKQFINDFQIMTSMRDVMWNGLGDGVHTFGNWSIKAKEPKIIKPVVVDINAGGNADVPDNFQQETSAPPAQAATPDVSMNDDIPF